MGWDSVNGDNVKGDCVIGGWGGGMEGGEITGLQQAVLPTPVPVLKMTTNELLWFTG